MFDLSQLIKDPAVGGRLSRVAERLGFHVTRTMNTLAFRRNAILANSPNVIVLDVGANIGQYARELRQYGFKGRIVSFEPIPEAYSRLKLFAEQQSDAMHTCHQLALGPREDEVQFNVTKDQVSSSIRSPIGSPADGQAIVTTINVRQCALDDVIPAFASSDGAYYLKLDTQGYEREVLMGAQKILSKTVAIEIELSLAQMYDGQALLPEIWTLITSSGFCPVWLERGYSDPKSKWLVQVDGLFVRPAN